MKWDELTSCWVTVCTWPYPNVEAFLPRVHGSVWSFPFFFPLFLLLPLIVGPILTLLVFQTPVCEVPWRLQHVQTEWWTARPYHPSLPHSSWHRFNSLLTNHHCSLLIRNLIPYFCLSSEALKQKLKTPSFTLKNKAKYHIMSFKRLSRPGWQHVSTGAALLYCFFLI